MKSFNKSVSRLNESVFSSISSRAKELNALNLGQGFADFLGPSWFQDFCADAFMDSDNSIHQYAPTAGRTDLRSEIAAVWQRNYQLHYAVDEVTICNGASEALYCSFKALINPGDEVILFEPFFDLYRGCAEMNGAKLVPVTLKAPDFTFDQAELQAAFSNKTKLLVLNSPHNPTGKVFSAREMNLIADLCRKWGVYVISDEVYQFLLYDDNQHLSFASIEGMQNQTICISSIAKTFGFTGWKLGWILANAKITDMIRKVHQYNTFCVCHPLQKATVKALQRLDDYLPSLRDLYQKKRDRFNQGLRDLGFEPYLPGGSFFSYVPIPNAMEDLEYCHYLLEKKGIASIPPSSFYLKSDDGKKYIRFCFAKTDEVLEKALRALQ